MSLICITPPAIEPVTLYDAKVQLGLDPRENADPVQAQILAARIRPLIATAREMVEDEIHCALITQTWRWARDGWPRRNMRYGREGYSELLLPKPPFQSIVSFTYTDVSGTSQDMTAWGYQLVDQGAGPQTARILPPFATPWPPLQCVPNNVLVEFICGYGDSPADIPIKIRQALLFIIQDLYENGSTSKGIPPVALNLLSAEMNRIS